MKKELSKQLAFIKMRVEGKTLLEISNDLGISFPTAVRWNKMHKSDVLQTQNARVEILRKKIMDRYNSYFDFLDSQLERLKTEISLHKEIAMTYPSLIKYSIKILEAQNRINIFRKYSYKPPDPDSPLYIDDSIPEQNSYQYAGSPQCADSPPEQNSQPDECSLTEQNSPPEQSATAIEENVSGQVVEIGSEKNTSGQNSDAPDKSSLSGKSSADIKNDSPEQSARVIKENSPEQSTRVIKENSPEQSTRVIEENSPEQSARVIEDSSA